MTEPTEKPTITTTPDRAGEVLIHLPDFTYFDSQQWSADIGIPEEALRGLRDAITAHLAAGESAEQQVKRLDRMAEAWAAQLPENVRTATVVDAVHTVTRPNGERP